MKLSILMPVYNEEARLPEAMKQALGVDYPCEIELVIVDDGSKDRTPEILAAADDLRIRVKRVRYAAELAGRIDPAADRVAREARGEVGREVAAVGVDAADRFLVAGQ